MKCKNLLATLLCLAMLVGMIPVMAFGSASALTLTSSYEPRKYYSHKIDAVEDFRTDGFTVVYYYGFDAKTYCPTDANDYIDGTTTKDWYNQSIYKGANYSGCNQWGTEIAVNEFGYVTAKTTSGNGGNMPIPQGGFVLSAVNGNNPASGKHETSATDLNVLDNLENEIGALSDDKTDDEGVVGLAYAQVSDWNNDGIEELVTIHNSMSDKPYLQLYTATKAEAEQQHSLLLDIDNIHIGFTVCDGHIYFVSAIGDIINPISTEIHLYGWDNTSFNEIVLLYCAPSIDEYTIDDQEVTADEFRTVYDRYMKGFMEISLEPEQQGILQAYVDGVKAQLHALRGNEASSPSISPYAITADVGDSVFFGHYEQDNNLENGPEPIEWIVLDHPDDGGTVLISHYALYTPTIHSNYKTSYTWENSPYREWLTDEFYPTAFTATEQTYILPSYVTYNIWKDRNPNDYFDKENTYASIIDRVYLLSLEESEEYFKTDESRCVSPTPYAVAKGAYRNEDDHATWWTRSANFDGNLYKMVTEFGNFSDQLNDYMFLDSFCLDYNKNVTLRPVIRVFGTPAQDSYEPADLSFVPRTHRVVTLGAYEQDGNETNGKEPIEWFVIDEDGNEQLLLSRYVLDWKEFDTSPHNATSADDSDLYTWLNNDFFDEAFTKIVQQAILDHGNGNVFLLDEKEAYSYLPLDIDRTADPTNHARHQYRISTEGNYFSDSPYAVHSWKLRDDLAVASNGFIGWSNFTQGIRPAVWVNSSLISDASEEKSTANNTTAADSTATTVKTDDAWRQAYLNILQNISSDDTLAYSESEYALRYINNDDIPELFVISPFVATGTTIYTYQNGNVEKTIISQGDYTYIPKENRLRDNGGRQDYYHDIIYAVEDGSLVEKQRGETHVASWSPQAPVMDYIRWNGEDVSQEQYDQYLADAIDPNRAVSIRDDGALYNYYSMCEELSD